MINQLCSYILFLLFLMCYYSYAACPSLIATRTTNVTCKYDDEILYNCLNPIEGTKAILSCNEFYEEPTIHKNPNRFCREGSWDGPIPNCYPICGKKRPKENFNQWNEENDNLLLDYPWHVGIYNSSTQEILCSGTLIAMNLVLTAQRCIIHEGDSDNIIVGAGKYYPAFLDKRDKFQQSSRVNNIVVRNRYQGTVGIYEFDLAILILTDPFVPSSFVQPVCMNFHKEAYFQKNGSVISWNYTNDTTTLKEIPLLFVPYNECRTNVPESIAIYITFDKICGANQNFGRLCRKNSGEGLIFKSIFNDRYYIAGIGSNLPGLDKVCDFNYYGVYTSIADHIEFLEKNLEYNQIMQNCQLPSFPQNGKYVLMNQKGKLEYKPEYAVPPHSMLTLICNSGYNFSSVHETQFSCSGKNGQWTPTLKDCIPQSVDDQTSPLDKPEKFDYTYSILIAAVIVLFVVALVVVMSLKLTFKKKNKLREKPAIARSSLQLKINEESSFQ